MKNVLFITLFVSRAVSQCNWCGASEVPEDVSHESYIASQDEPGERLNIYGKIFKTDGITPAKDVIVYVYHTNAKGVYPKSGTETGNGKYHGYLRGWMKTNSDGKYVFHTIKPAPYYCHGGEPAHIHYTIKPPNEKEYWLTATWFDGDKRITDNYKKSVKRSGGFSNIIKLKKDQNGVLVGERNIIIEKY